MIVNIKSSISLFLTLFSIFCLTCAQAQSQMPPPVRGSFICMDTDEGQGDAGKLPGQPAPAPGYPWRGLLIGADHGYGDIHHDNIYASINGGPVIYQTTIPARKSGNLLPDAGLLWHFYSRDSTEITVYATSSLVNGLESGLSEAFSVFFSYPFPFTCTEQTVPLSHAGNDQVVAVGTEVLLDASMSQDAYGPDNDSLAYRWECYAAPEPSVLISDEGRKSVVRFIPGQSGNYYFRLTVRDMKDGAVFNRSPVSYARVRAVSDISSYISANPGGPQQAGAGSTVTLDGSRSQGSSMITHYTWTLENPLGPEDIEAMSLLLGTQGCQAGCIKSDFDADPDVDGMDLALLAANYSGIHLPDQAVVQFVAGIARPHIFRLTVTGQAQTDSDTTIVSVHHPAADPLLKTPDVDPVCLY